MKIVATTTSHRDAAAAATPSFEKYVSAATLENDVQCRQYTLHEEYIVAAAEKHLGKSLRQRTWRPEKLHPINLGSCAQVLITISAHILDLGQCLSIRDHLVATIIWYMRSFISEQDEERDD